uniref:Uncharacterized protein n=1 Tax=Vitis vinifera TaxID=29760 RepID=F6I502_VITVI
MPVRSDSLYGLPLVPLANGLFTAFDKMGVGERIYIARGDEYGLLKDSIPHQLVDSGIPEGIHMKLCDIAQTEDLNISFLTCYLLEKLFLRLLPAEWQHAKQVIWNPGHQGQPSLEWLRLLWSYLKSCCDDLSEFSKWPILPVGNNYLLKLIENSNVIKDDGWSENMCSLLLKVGCLFLRNDLPIEHPQLKNYVQLPIATGILNALLALAHNPENVQKLFCDASEGELHELRSFILQSKWFSEGQMDDTHIDVIKHLPMFESFRSRKLVCLSKPTKLLKPNGVSEDLLNDDFVRTDSEKERIILRRYLEVKEPSRAQFYKDYVVTCMPEFLSQQGALSAILHDVKLLIEEDTSIKLTLSITPFFLAANGSWQQPSRLYDPRVPELQDMLHREVFFPLDKFSDPETLETLVSLGLRQSLGFTGLLDFARSVSIFHDSRDSKTLAQGRRLLTCLDVVALKLSTENGEGDCNRCENATLGQNSSVDDGNVKCLSRLKQQFFLCNAPLQDIIFRFMERIDEDSALVLSFLLLVVQGTYLGLSKGQCCLPIRYEILSLREQGLDVQLRVLTEKKRPPESKGLEGEDNDSHSSLGDSVLDTVGAEIEKTENETPKEKAGASDDLEPKEVEMDGWLFRFTQLFRTHVGIDPDVHIDLHELGMGLCSEALEETMTRLK